MTRTVSALLAAGLAANALAMLAAGLWWYGVVPGVTATGAYNPHFVRDIGAAYLVAAAGLAWYAVRPVQGWPGAVLAAGFLGLHAAVHIFDAACSATPARDALRDLPGVYLPALAAAVLAARKPATERSARNAQGPVQPGHQSL